MNKFLRFLVINLAILSLSACSIAPGIPGLDTSSSKNAKPQKEGVDYKLIVIDSDAINAQKPFDYVAYVRNKKRRASVSDLQSRFNDKNKQDVAKVASRANNRINQKAQNVRYSAKDNIIRFEGITAKDNKANYQYYLGKGDVLNITVWDQPELIAPSENNTFVGHVIGNDGSFYFPHAGKINAAGKSAREIRDELERKLGSFVTKPQVSVSVANFRSQKVYTSGALANPSTLVISDTPTTVRDAISSSGGLKSNQYTGFATLARNNKNISIDLNRMLKYNDNRQNFILKNGDRLNVIERTELDEFNRKLNLEVQKVNTLNSVRLRNQIDGLKTLNPIKLQFELQKQRSIARLKNELERELRSEQAKVFVMGEVVKPGSVKYRVEDGMTLAEAINDAGSFKEESVDPKGIFVVRKENNNDKIPTIYQLPISSVQSMFLAEQFGIRPRDIVYVTATPSIRWNRVLAQLLPSLVIFK